MKASFEKLIAMLPPHGFLVAAADNPHSVSLAASFKGRVLTYGLSERAGLRAKALLFSGEGASFEVIKEGRFAQGKRLGVVKSPLAGRHNVQNLLGVIGLLLEVGVSFDEMARAVETFPGIKRRQEVRGIVSDVVVIDDFAHHPTAIQETVAAIRSRYAGYRIWALFEPRSNTSRRCIFQREFAQALRGADRVVVAGLYQPEKIPEGERLDGEQLCRDIAANGGPKASFIPEVDPIVRQVIPEIAPPTVLLVMSNGGFGGIHQKLLAALSERFKAEI